MLGRGESLLRPPGVPAHPAGVFLAALEAGAEHVVEDDGDLAGDAGVLVVVAVAGLGVDEGQLQLLQGEGWGEGWGGEQSSAQTGGAVIVRRLSGGPSLLSHTPRDARQEAVSCRFCMPSSASRGPRTGACICVRETLTQEPAEQGDRVEYSEPEEELLPPSGGARTGHAGGTPGARPGHAGGTHGACTRCGAPLGLGCSPGAQAGGRLDTH